MGTGQSNLLLAYNWVIMSSTNLKLSDVPGDHASVGQLIGFACSMNGYEVAGGFHECADIAEAPNRNSVDELRIAMFFHLRAIRHGGQEMDEGDVKLLRDHTSRIRELLIEGGNEKASDGGKDESIPES